MTDMEKVINDLSTALVQMHGPGRYTLEDVDELEKAGWQALKLLALLKEQDAVDPQKAPFPDASRSDGSWYYICGACSKPIDPIDKYCRWCGRSVKWDDI